MFRAVSFLAFLATGVVVKIWVVLPESPGLGQCLWVPCSGSVFTELPVWQLFFRHDVAEEAIRANSLRLTANGTAAC